MKDTDAMIDLLKGAQATSHHADGVLFNTWLASTAWLIAVITSYWIPMP